MIFITHDLRVAAEVSDHILVMQKGEAVEYGSVDAVFGNPQLAYTRHLLSAMPGKGWEAPTFPSCQQRKQHSKTGIAHETATI